MTNLRESANEYVPNETHNISELDKVSVDAEIKEVTGTKKNGEEFKYKVVEVNGLEYRVPNSVIKQLKAHLEERPEMTSFKVRKAGEGLNTEYTLIVLD